jgi:hypothetical protein
MKMSENQHGQFQLQWQGNILTVVYEGVWNEVASANLHQQAKILWRLHKFTSWGLISDARKWDGATAEALTLWWEFFEDAVDNGLIAVTDILPSKFHEAMVSPLAERASKIALYKRSKDLIDAVHWMQSQGLKNK